MIPDPNALPPLADDLFYDLAQLIYDECGMRFEENNRFLLHKRLAARLAILGIPGLREYYLYLKYDPARRAEYEVLHSHLTTNETYFMREKGQLIAFTAHVAELVKAGGSRKRFSIWSAGCSSGEEPYSLAILLTEAGLGAKDFEIIGTDISLKVLNKAREAVYTSHSFRFQDEAFREKYFTPVAGNYSLKEPWRSMVRFSVLNLYRDEKLGLFGMFDAIFCRNVLIYFDNESKLQVLGNLHNRLLPTGFLFLGHSESLLTLSSPFKMNRLGGEFAYTK